MRIGIDARELSGRPTGVGRYLAGLLSDWAGDAGAQRHEFILYSASAISMPLDTRRFVPRIVPGAGGSWWEQISVPPIAASDHLDLWFAPGYTAPLRIDMPIVVTVHDLSFFAHPEWFRIREGIRRRFICGRSVAAARAVVTVSEFSRQELIERLDVPAAKIHVIPHAIHRPLPEGQSSAHGSAPNVLYVGSVFNRRHVPDLIRAFAPIARAHADARLDIVGDDRTYPPENIAGTIAAEGVDAQVRWHRYVDDEQLRQLYASARAFAFLSEYEGFGMTPVEALAAGIPSVLLDTPVARETCGEAALYVQPADLRSTTRALERLLFDDETRSELLSNGVHSLARYAPGRAGRDTLALLIGIASC